MKMKIPRRYKTKRRSSRKNNLPVNRFVRLILFTLTVVFLASVYIYQRVWVRELDNEIKKLQKKNELAEEFLSELKIDWIEASTLINVEKAIAVHKLGLQPTMPHQNLIVNPVLYEDRGRYAGFFKAFDKLKEGIPFIAPSEAEANQLFEVK
ncbi:MAG: hypothetical protein V3V99_08945 [candidate division Zixibacteria bacterium]